MRGINTCKAFALGLTACLLAFSQQPAAAETVKFTLLLVNDFYKMNEEKGRGGMARLAAAVKAERARGGNLIIRYAPQILPVLDEMGGALNLADELWASDALVVSRKVVMRGCN